MADRYKLTGETKIKYGVKLHRVLWIADNREGGWISDKVALPRDGDAVLYGDVELYGGEFRGGVFWDGEFRDGVFWDGVFRGGVFHHSPSCAQRSDGYMFVAKHVDSELRIWAGCRNFSWDEAVAHWNDEHPHGAESQRIIHFLKAQAEAEEARDKTARGQNGGMTDVDED